MKTQRGGEKPQAHYLYTVYYDALDEYTDDRAVREQLVVTHFPLSGVSRLLQADRLDAFRKSDNERNYLRALRASEEQELLARTDQVPFEFEGIKGYQVTERTLTHAQLSMLAYHTPRPPATGAQPQPN